MILCACALLFLLPFDLFSQNITYTEDSGITDMMEVMVAKNRSMDNINGWRIQILATTDRQKLEDARAIFLSKYPGINIDWIHEKPYYKLRVGAFASTLDASFALNQLKLDYPGAYAVKDKVKILELIDL